MTALLRLPFQRSVAQWRPFRSRFCSTLTLEKKPIKWKRTKMLAGGLLVSGSVFYVSCDYIAPRIPSRIQLEDGSEVVFSDMPCNPYWMYLRWVGIDRYLSRLFGFLAEIEIPERMRWYIFKSFGKAYGIVWKDFRPDIEVYKTFNEFFTRRLEGVRPVYQTSLVSPVDGVVLSQGRVESNKLEQIKGVTFRLDSFLGFTPELDSTENSLYYCVLYLRPGGYHRFHSPTNAVFDHCNHFPGALLPVKTNVVKGYPGLFSINERVVLSGTWKENWFFAYAAVGATNVGSIEIYEDEELVTNKSEQDKDSLSSGYKNQVDEPYPNKHPKNPNVRSYSHSYDDPMTVVSGQEIGQFLMGSTIVLVFEATNAEFKLEEGQATLMGQPLVEVD